MKRDTIYTTTVGGRIRALRIGKGLTQEELGLMVGIENKAIISAYEHDSRTVTLAVLPGIAKVLGTTIDYLITGNAAQEDDKHLNDEQQLAMEIIHSLKTEKGKRAALEHLRIVAMME